MEPEQINKCYCSKEVWDVLLQPVLRKLPSPAEGASSPQRHPEEGASNRQRHVAFQHPQTPVSGELATRGRREHGICSNHTMGKLTPSNLMKTHLPSSSFDPPDAKNDRLSS